MITKKNFIFLFIPYLTISCSLYHLVYWALFGLNGLELISIEEIIKSSIKPLIISIIALIVSFILAHITIFGYILPKVEGSANKISYGKEIILRRRKRFSITLKIILSLLIIYSYFFKPDKSWFILAFLLGPVIYRFIDGDKVFSNDFKLTINKIYLILLIIYLPLFCAFTAIYNAKKIINNKSYQYSVRIINNPPNKPIADTIKFIGITEKNFVFINMTNDKIYFLKQDSMTLNEK